MSHKEKTTFDLKAWKAENEGMIAVADHVSRQNRLGLGGNNPPTPIETCIAEYDGIILEATNWADGEPVTDEAGMNAIDKVLKGIKTYRSALDKAAKEQTAPPHAVWKAAVAAAKVYTDDADRLQAALVACVGPFKAKLAADKAEADRAAQSAAWEATRAAREAAAKANAGDIEQARAAAAAIAEAEALQRAANAAAKDTVKGMRTVTHYEVTDYRALLHFIAKNDKDAVTDFVAEWARGHHKTRAADGLRVWTTKESF
jgi:hypothetical protein